MFLPETHAIISEYQADSIFGGKARNFIFDFDGVERVPLSNLVEVDEEKDNPFSEVVPLSEYPDRFIDMSYPEILAASSIKNKGLGRIGGALRHTGLALNFPAIALNFIGAKSLNYNINDVITEAVGENIALRAISGVKDDDLRTELYGTIFDRDIYPKTGGFNPLNIVGFDFSNPYEKFKKSVESYGGNINKFIKGLSGQKKAISDLSEQKEEEEISEF